MLKEEKILSLFLGPKAENANYFEELILLVLRDYCHWRRNYYPGDRILVTKKLQRELDQHYDRIYQNTLEMTAELRRNFPFYSPRYLAHMLSDTLLPSMIGYMAGMLYNPNNVTPEAAPVTVDMEIDACNELLEMLGYTPPPSIPSELDTISINEYKKQLQKEFGWAHLTLGGSTANLEALWVARAVRYTSLSIWDVANQEDLSIQLKQPDGTQKDVRRFTSREILSIKVNEAIYLLARFVDAVRIKHSLTSVKDAGVKAQSLLKQSRYSLNKGLGRVFEEFPPVIFVSGTAHYSVFKAADILGIGRDNVEMVKADSNYRMDVEHLEQKIKQALAQKRIPLAVIAIVGTTEEGSVDPVHEIQDLRVKLEKNENASFWLHVDAAWGGYIRSLFNMTQSDCLNAVLANISDVLTLSHSDDILTWNERFFAHLEEKILQYPEKEFSDEESGRSSGRSRLKPKNVIRRDIESTKERMKNSAALDNPCVFLRILSKFVNTYREELGLDGVRTDLTLNDRIELINDFVSDEVTIHWGRYRGSILMKWGSKDVCSSFLALPKADSITLDPHKMGYVNYPSGMVAFKNDRVRHFVLQKAPYITSVRQEVLVHLPPRHLEESPAGARVVTEAFAPFIVEGSRPGAAGTSLWATIKTIPPTMNEAGLVVRASLLAARELHEWLVHWDKIMDQNREDVFFDFIPLTLYPPDTNIVIFAVKRKNSNLLAKMNALSGLVYEHFTIQAELGETEYSYAQPFFLSKTIFQEPSYTFETLKPVLERYFSKGYSEQLFQSYRDEGITVLRATLMNPYISLTRKLSSQNVLKEFMQELHRAAAKAVQEL